MSFFSLRGKLSIPSEAGTSVPGVTSETLAPQIPVRTPLFLGEQASQEKTLVAQVAIDQRNSFSSLEKNRLVVATPIVDAQEGFLITSADGRTSVGRVMGGMTQKASKMLIARRASRAGTLDSRFLRPFSFQSVRGASLQNDSASIEVAAKVRGSSIISFPQDQPQLPVARRRALNRALHDTEWLSHEVKTLLQGRHAEELLLTLNYFWQETQYEYFMVPQSCCFRHVDQVQLILQELASSSLGKNIIDQWYKPIFSSSFNRSNTELLRYLEHLRSLVDTISHKKVVAKKAQEDFRAILSSSQVASSTEDQLNRAQLNSIYQKDIDYTREILALFTSHLEKAIALRNWLQEYDAERKAAAGGKEILEEIPL